MEKPRWSTKFFKRNILIKLFMKVQIELFGVSREFSNQNYLEFDIENDSTIKDIRKNLIDYLIKNFNGNENFIKIKEKLVLFMQLLPSKENKLMFIKVYH